MSNQERFEGTVIFFSNAKGKSYGFIAWKDHPDLFVHYSDIVSEGYKTLKKDSKVSFSTGLNAKGVIKATEVIEEK